MEGTAGSETVEIRLLDAGLTAASHGLRVDAPSDPLSGAVMTRTTRTILGIAAIVILAFASCDDGIVSPPAPPAQAYLQVSPGPSEPWFLRPGRSLRLQVTIHMPDGSTPTSYGLAFSSLDSTILRVDSTGYVTALRVGTSRIRVTGQDGAVAEWQTDVFGVVDRVVVTADTDTLIPHLMLSLQAETRSGGGPAPADTVTWSSSDTSVVRVLGGNASSATIEAVGPGTATLTVRADSATASRRLSVRLIEFVSLALGTNGTCGLDARRRLYCWGGHSFSSLTRAWIDPGYPAPMYGTYAAVDFWYNSCTLDSAGRAGCFLGWSGLTLAGTVAVAAGETHFCALDAAGVVRCIGQSDKGQAGSISGTCTTGSGKGSTSTTFPCVLTPTPVAEAPVVARLSAGRLHTCVLSTGGAIHCWGDNTWGQLGDGGTSWRYQARPVGAAGPFIAVSAGDGFTCALDAGGTAWCWGRNDLGQLGNGTTTGSLTPQQVVGAPQFAAIGVTRGSHVCALTAAGEAWCWGSNAGYQLGSAAASGTVPSAVGTALRFRSIATGGAHSCGVDTDGIAWCWGFNAQAQLGVGTAVGISAAPLRVASQP